MIDSKPDISCLHAFGTDGEEALYQAIQAVCHEEVHLLCFIHSRNNIKEKLKQIGYCRYIWTTSGNVI